MSVTLRNPVFQFVDSNGRPYAGGSLTFYESGTSTPLDTYSDVALSTPNTNPIILNSAGWPETDIFLQNRLYRVILKDVNGNTIWVTDNVASTDFSSVTVTKVGSGNPNGSVAGTAGSSGVLPTVYWDYTNNRLYICSTTGTTATAVWTAINTSNAQLVWTIADIISSAPAPAAEGTSYIVGVSFGSFVAGQIVTDNGFGGLVVTQPPVNSGWIAYVQSEGLYYHFIGSEWVQEGATYTDDENRAGTVFLASRANMEALADDVPLAVTPARQHFHPGHPKAWGRVQSDGALLADYNVASITKNGTGDYTVNIENNMGNTNYAIQLSVEHSGSFVGARYTSIGAGSFGVLTQDASTDTATDAGFSFTIFGTAAA
jgi:hypothetical protein